MNIHEYQAKELFRRFGVPTPRGRAASTVEEAVSAAEALDGPPWVVKAQIHAGGRGKAGGVRLCRSVEELRQAAGGLLGRRLVTRQTGAEGRLVRRLYVEEGVEIGRELYLSLLIDRACGRPAFVVSPAGGMEIEQVAAERPEAIGRYPVEEIDRIDGPSAAAVARFLAVEEGEMRPLLQGLLELFVRCDASLIELNPLVVRPDGRLVALDAKMAIDDNALFRQQELAGLRDPDEEDAREREAAAFGLNYVALDGDIGCMVNGAGLAMATMDVIQLKGARPANFLDVGGGVTVERAAAGFRLLFSDSQVRAVLVNIFGGIVRCDIIANGLVAARARQVRKDLPVLMRLVGTHEEEGRAIIRDAGIDVRWAQTLDEAAGLAVAAL
ncbi:MAG: ADP-forming succinate--CoA ligase subunit beta [Zetaproteobacteria bacterium]|nr:MAG: ADP-forming succinate--CoA ligase subunit beta [Zetaproteobacteria bacterium]